MGIIIVAITTLSFAYLALRLITSFEEAMDAYERSERIKAIEKLRSELSTEDFIRLMRGE